MVWQGMLLPIPQQAAGSFPSFESTVIVPPALRPEQHLESDFWQKSPGAQPPSSACPQVVPQTVPSQA
jgi:hypothetical protein